MTPEESAIRFTVVDNAGIVSFVGPGHCLKMLAASCSRSPATHRDLLRGVQTYDGAFANRVLAGLAVFDEHVSPDDDRSPVRWRASHPQHETLPFRVIDDEARRHSLEPARLGVVILNLVQRRIVEIENRYAGVRRRDRGRMRENGRPTSKLYYYSLPEEWAILP